MEATINGARIHFERKGSGFPVILLHAGVADHRMWEPQVEAFAAHFDVITPDMRGFGWSELPSQPWSPVEDLRALIDELGLKPAHMVGCSMGGAIDIDFALQHSERMSRLVVVGAGIGGTDFGSKYPELFTEINAAEEAHDLEALNTAEMHLWLDGPRRRHGYVKEPLRELFLDMNGKNFGADFEKAPIERRSAGRRTTP